MSSDHRYGLILAGGRGTRFWPKSRRAKAKQVLSFGGERTLIQQTVDRLAPLLAPERIWIITNDYLLEEIRSQLPEVPAEQIIAEPAQRNTAPCIGLAGHILSSLDKEAVMGVFPADHIIGNPERYLQLLQPAFEAAEGGKIAVLGIEPRWAETGYGYIEFDSSVEKGKLQAAPVKRFREKPDLKTAEEFVAAGNFYWNAGMFFWRTEVLLGELERYQPKTAGLIRGLPEFRDSSFPQELTRTFGECENISIDYAVLEKTASVVGIAADDIGWNDVGSWNAVYELLERDANENVALADAVLEGSSGNYVDAKGKLVALLGVKDLIVVDTPDALLIADRNRAQDVGLIVKALEKRGRNELL